MNATGEYLMEWMNKAEEDSGGDANGSSFCA
jgi:hypothetical protein